MKLSDHVPTKIKSKMLLLGLLLSVAVAANAETSLPLWPLPWKYSVSNQVVGLSSTFTFSAVATNPILDAAFARYLKLFAVPSNAVGSLNSCQISVSDVTTPKDVVSADESYDLNVDGTSCKISASTTWGALRGLETFSQLLSRVNDNVQLSIAPVSISDKPRYDHRGLLVDTARHYQPVSEIKRIIDSMPYNKLNVFHWHIVDAESFPVNTPSEPTMVQGAFSPSMTYSLADLQDVRTYALYRGVEVIIELDMPGHAASWTKGKKEVMADCFAKYYYNINDFALNPALDLTYITIQHILQDIVNATLSRYIHLGGDEVVYGCWKNDTSVVAFMQENNIPSYDALLGYFVQRVDKNVLGGDEDSPKTVQTVIHWEEVFTAQAPLDAANTVYQVWTDSSKVSAITAAKYRVIASPSDFWYFVMGTPPTWTTMYNYDPAQGLSSEQQAYVIGGEAALWAEFIDEYNIESQIYPRASAVAERLWSSADMTSDSSLATDRLIAQKCRMINRGIKSSPVQPADYCNTVHV